RLAATAREPASFGGGDEQGRPFWRKGRHRETYRSRGASPTSRPVAAWRRTSLPRYVCASLPGGSSARHAKPSALRDLPGTVALGGSKAMTPSLRSSAKRATASSPAEEFSTFASTRTSWPTVAERDASAGPDVA